MRATGRRPQSQRREARAIDSTVPVFSVRTVEQLLDQTVAQPRFNLILLGLFAVVALMLAAVILACALSLDGLKPSQIEGNISDCI